MPLEHPARRRRPDRERRAAASRTKEALVKDFRTGEILDAAVRVIADSGFADASVEQIAREAGVAKGTLYLYFENKQALLARTLEHLLTELVGSTRKALARRRSPRRRLEEIVRVGLRHSTQHAAFLQAIRGASPTPSSAARAHVEDYLSLVAEVLESGAHSGDFRSVDTRSAARALVEIMRAFVMERIEREPDVELAVNQIVDFFLNGVGRGER